MKIQKLVEKFQDIFVFGYFGEADAFANCSDGGGFGCQAVTEAFTDVVTETGTVTSVSLAESAASGNFDSRRRGRSPPREREQGARRAAQSLVTNSTMQPHAFRGMGLYYRRRTPGRCPVATLHLMKIGAAALGAVRRRLDGKNHA